MHPAPGILCNTHPGPAVTAVGEGPWGLMVPANARWGWNMELLSPAASTVRGAVVWNRLRLSEEVADP